MKDENIANLKAINAFEKELYINLTNDNFDIIKDIENENNSGIISFKEYINFIKNTDKIHFDDLEEFSSKLDIDYLKKYFKDNNKLHFCYRRVLNGFKKWVKIVIEKTPNYKDDNQELYLYLINIDDTVNEMKAKNHDINSKKDVEDSLIINSIASIYYSIHFIDLNLDTITEIRSQNVIREYINTYKNASIQIENLMNNILVPSSVKKALDFTNLKTIKERMGFKKIITEDLLATQVGWMRVNFIPVAYKDNELSQVLMVVRIVDEEKRREESLIDFSYTDELTRLYNRRAYENDLNNIRKKTLKSNLSFIIFDVNELKKVNDSLGHKAGDELLKITASIISEVFTSVGRCYRTGGDEFAVIASTSPKEVNILLEQLAQLLNNTKGKFVSKVSVSVGVASIDEFPNFTIDDLEKMADKKMYENKKNYYKKNDIIR